MADIHVFGSLNADLVTRIHTFPAAGETRRADGFAIHAGGKGANQAVAAGKLGADVAMFGAIGEDALARHLTESLATAGVKHERLARRSGFPTGTASIWVDANGENAIAIAAGANGSIDDLFVDQHFDDLMACRYLLLQGEIPINSMAHLLDRLGGGDGDDGGDGSEDGGVRPRVILDPAPVFDLSDLPRGSVWLATPNEHELRELADRATGSANEIQEACRVVHERYGIERVVCKAGSRGAFLWTPDRFLHAEAFEVDPVDTTAAGDAFNGGLAAALVDGADLKAALGFANAVAALAVTREGAQPAMPSREDVETFLADRP